MPESRIQNHQVLPNCTMLHQSAPSCTKLHKAAPKWTTLHQSAPSCTKLHQVAPNCTKLHQSEPSRTNLHQVAPKCTKLHQSAPNCTKLPKLHQVAPDCTKVHQTTPCCTNLHQVATHDFYLMLKCCLFQLCFFLTGRLCSGGKRFDWSNVIFAAYFKLRGHDTQIDFLRSLFLVGMICPLMQENFFFDLFWNVKFFIAAK